jgi:hypothetical protein
VNTEKSNKNRVVAPIGDGKAVAIGGLAGALGGILLGLLIAWSTSPGWSLTSIIIVFHVTVAMIAMGAWCAPSIVSDPDLEEGAVCHRQIAESPAMLMGRDSDADREIHSADAPAMSV